MKQEQKKVEVDKPILEINLNKLDEDCQSLPRQMFEWGTNLAAARRTTRKAENNAKLAYAETEQDVRACPQKFDIEKPTEAAIKSAILIHPDYKYAQEELIRAEYEQDVLWSFMEALRAKKDMLEMSVRLHGAMYFSKPNLVPSAEDRDEVMRSVAEEVKDRKKRQ